MGLLVLTQSWLSSREWELSKRISAWLEGMGKAEAGLFRRCTVRGNGLKLEKRRFQLGVRKIKSP